MEKTTVYLTSEQKAALTKAARAEGRSEARLIRDGIEGVVARHRAGEAAASPAGVRATAPATDAEPQARPRWISRDAFVRRFAPVQADASLAAELRELAPDTTDDLRDR